MPELTPGARRLAAEQGRDRRPQGATHWEVGQAQVTAVTSGGASDGNALVTVDYRGALQDAAYLASYTSPAVGHQVAVEVSSDGALLIIGRVIGTP